MPAVDILLLCHSEERSDEESRFFPATRRTWSIAVLGTTNGRFELDVSASGGMFRSDRFASGVTVLARFRPRQIEVSMQSVKRCGRKLVSPLLKLGLGPVPVQADGIVGEVLRKGQPVLAFTDQDVANSTPG